MGPIKCLLEKVVFGGISGKAGDAPDVFLKAWSFHILSLTIFVIHSGHRRVIFRWYEDFVTISIKSRSRTFFLLPAQLRDYYSDSMIIYSDYIFWLLVLVALCFYIPSTTKGLKWPYLEVCPNQRSKINNWTISDLSSQNVHMILDFLDPPMLDFGLEVNLEFLCYHACLEDFVWLFQTIHFDEIYWNIIKFEEFTATGFMIEGKFLNQKIDGGMGPAEFAICHPPIKNCYHSPKENIQDQTKNSSICWRSKMVIPKDQGCLNFWSSKQNDFRPHVMVKKPRFHWGALKGSSIS